MGKDNNKEPTPVGRPKLYKPSMNDQVYKLCLLGATDNEIADFFEVDVSTINRWKLSEVEFCESIRRGKFEADMNVAKALYKRALGYETRETKISNDDVVTTTKEVAPDTAAAFIWLKNRQPSKWRDKQEIEHSGEMTVNNKQELYEKYLKEE